MKKNMNENRQNESREKNVKMGMKPKLELQLLTKLQPKLKPYLQMKPKLNFISGFVLGGLAFSSAAAIAAGGIWAEPSQQVLYVNEQKAAVQAYNIAGNNYFKLRDIGETLNVQVEYDTAKNAIMLDTNKPYGSTEKETPSGLSKENKQDEAQVNARENADVEVNVQITQAATQITAPPTTTVTTSTQTPSAPPVSKQTQTPSAPPVTITSPTTTAKSVATQFDANHRPISIATNTGDIIYGTGNDKTINPNAIGEWDGYFEITGSGKPLEPALGSYDLSWQGYQDIKYPNPIPAYSNTPSPWVDGRCLFVFNAHETQRLIDELYRTLYRTPECFTNGQLNCKVMIGMTEYGFNTNHFYPYRASEVSKHVIGGNRVYIAYAVDIYQNGMFDCTKYIVAENGGYDYKTGTVELWDELLNSDTAVMSYRQDR